MEKLKEDVFAQLFGAGAFSAVWIELDQDGKACVCYRFSSAGAFGAVHTKRSQLKTYKPDTALRFLRLLGMNEVRVALNNWHPEQNQSTIDL